MVPIEFVGESQAVKDGNVLITVTDEVEVEALPADLPESIEVDLAVLDNLEAVVTVADLKVDTTVVTILTDSEQLIAKVEEPKEEVVEEETTPADVEVITEKKEEAGEDEEKKEE